MAERPGRAASFPPGSQVNILAGEYVGLRGTIVAQRDEWGLYVVVDGHLLRSIAEERLRLPWSPRHLMKPRGGPN